MKKIICIILSMVLLCSNVVYAEEIIDETVTVTPIGGGDVSPLYKNITAIHSALQIVDGVATCTGDYTMSASKTSEIELVLQRKKGNKGFSDYKTWSKKNTGDGFFALTKIKNVASGYDYRLKVVIKVYSGNKVVEAGACYSHTVSR